MKKIFIPCLLLAFNLIYSQIERINTESIKCEKIGGIKPMGSFMIENEKCGDTYRFTYRDMKFSKLTILKSFEFKDIDNAYKNLFDMIKDGFENDNQEPIMLNLPNDIIIIKFEKFMGIKVFKFQHAENKNPNVIGISQQFSKNQFLKIFGQK